MNSIEQRVREAQKLGFTKVYVPKKITFGGREAPEGIEIIGVSTIGETLRKVFLINESRNNPFRLLVAYDFFVRPTTLDVFIK